MKKLLLLMLAVAPLSAIAYPTHSVEIVPLAKLEIPDEFKKSNSVNIKQMKTKGYIEMQNNDVKPLLSMKYNNRYIIKDGKSNIASKSNNDPYDTHLKKDASEIRLAFVFKNKIKNGVIGYAPIGTYIKGQGWTGIREFFADDKLGTCSISFSNFALSHGSVQLAAEMTTYDINGKATTYYAKGNINSGFTYILSWFDEIYTNHLECAKMVFDAGMKKKMVALAQSLDSKS